MRIVQRSLHGDPVDRAHPESMTTRLRPELLAYVFAPLLGAALIAGEIAFFYNTITQGRWLMLAIGLGLPPVGTFQGLGWLVGIW